MVVDAFGCSTNRKCFMCGMYWHSTTTLPYPGYCPRLSCRVRNIKGLQLYPTNVTNTTN